jgi:glycosyltransferase involved in cell wall biosynthesis
VREVVPPDADLLARPGDLDDLERIVRRLIEDPDARVAAGEACAAHVRSTFSEVSVVERLRGIYRELGVLP